MGPLQRYDQVDLSRPPVRQTARPNPLVEIIDAVIEWPMHVGMALLAGAGRIWQTRVHRLVKILAVVILVPPAVLLLVLSLAH
jgi:hypothetical protein